MMLAYHAHNWVVILRWNARSYGILGLGGFWTLKCEKQVRHCAYDVGVSCAQLGRDFALERKILWNIRAGRFLDSKM